MILHQLSLLASLLVLQRGFTLPVHGVSDPGLPLQLTVTPAMVNRYSAKQMSLRCEHNPSISTKLAKVFIIRILRQTTSGWDFLAEQRDNEVSPKVSGNVAASGNVQGDISDVFLQVSWDTLGPDCFGVFKCNMVGFDANDDAVTERSSKLEIDEFKNFIHHLIGLSMDTQERMLEMENFTDTAITRLNSGVQRFAVSVTTNQSAFDSRLDNVELRLAQQEISTDTEIALMQTQITDIRVSVAETATDTSQMKKQIQDNNVSIAASDTKIAKLRRKLQDKEDLVRRIESRLVSAEDRVARLVSLFERFIYWPSGQYALLQPQTGCPADPMFSGGNQASYLKLHTESQASSDPSNNHSSVFQSNMTFTDGSDKLVTLKFCEVTRQINTMSWPQGSFCVHKLSNQDCPTGFSDGYVHFDTEDTNDKTEDNSNVAAGSDLYFCCQNSTSAYLSIVLPTHSPFFLYRKGGVCQAVQGMSVSEEYVQINTEDDRNNDRPSGSYPDIEQPGSSVIKLNLCYYTKRLDDW
ncbi:apextrin-like protein [Elysia marginata]|uniref:Apextrin-like protein n=1 Tax=Elysia marginata TaxID=1093978 RepID=A0AAV4I0W8_9GAST|nr:apextrin-like protein [Elysia marginata]